MRYVCTECGDRFTGEELTELHHEGEQFSLHPFICPDCYDRINRMDLEDHLSHYLRKSS